jgi:hypothetical protein
VDERAVVNARVGHDAGFQPERASVYGAGRRDTPHPPIQNVNRSVVTHAAPPREPNHFAQPDNRDAHSFDRNSNPGGRDNRGGNGAPNSQVMPARPPQRENQPPQQTQQQVQSSAPPQSQGNSGRQNGRFAGNDDRTAPPPTHPAPPVHAASPQVRQNEQQKQQTWQNAHPRNDDSGGDTGKGGDKDKGKGKGRGGN